MNALPLRLASGAALAAACLLSACAGTSPAAAGCNDGHGNALPCPLALTPFVQPTSIAVDGANVYWASDYSSVQACPVSGCAGPPLTLGLSGLGTTLAAYAGLPGPPVAVATDGTNVFWLSQEYVDSERSIVEGAVAECSVTGCDSPTWFAQGQGITSPDSGGSIVVDSANVYWTDQGQQGPDDRSIKKCPRQGCTAPVVLAHQPEPEPASLSGLEAYLFSSVGPLAVDGVNAYWFHDGDLLSCGVGGCGDQPTVLVRRTGASAIATDGTNVYWTVGAPDGGVLSCPVTGCERPTVLASGQVWAMAIATDGVNVYWVAQSGTAADAPGQVLRCPVNGCNDAPETVATKADAGLFAQPAIAVDATNVYWVSAGAIMKRAK